MIRINDNACAAGIAALLLWLIGFYTARAATPNQAQMAITELGVSTEPVTSPMAVINRTMCDKCPCGFLIDVYCEDKLIAAKVKPGEAVQIPAPETEFMVRIVAFKQDGTEYAADSQVFPPHTYSRYRPYRPGRIITYDRFET